MRKLTPPNTWNTAAFRRDHAAYVGERPRVAAEQPRRVSLVPVVAQEHLAAVQDPAGSNGAAAFAEETAIH